MPIMKRYTTVLQAMSRLRPALDMRRYLGWRHIVMIHFRLHGSHILWPRFPAGSPNVRFGNSTYAVLQPPSVNTWVWADGCATGLQTRSRHVCEFLSASLPLSSGSASDFVGTFARCHGSRLFTLRLPFVLRPAVCFLHRWLFGRFSRVLPGPRVLPGSNAHFVLPFGLFHLADPALLFAEPPESFARADAQ
jgi:hypothetical protein